MTLLTRKNNDECCNTQLDKSPKSLTDLPKTEGRKMRWIWTRGRGRARGIRRVTSSLEMLYKRELREGGKEAKHTLKAGFLAVSIPDH